ncbi:MAG: hypothetical protein WCP86_07470, partial [bacterium]
MAVRHTMRAGAYRIWRVQFRLIYCIVRRAMFILSFWAMPFLGGCAHTGKTDESVPERISIVVAAAIKASVDASSFDKIAMRAVENAEACKNAADDQLSHATSSGNPD